MLTAISCLRERRVLVLGSRAVIPSIAYRRAAKVSVPLGGRALRNILDRKRSGAADISSIAPGVARRRDLCAGRLRERLRWTVGEVPGRMMSFGLGTPAKCIRTEPAPTSASAR
jgi:hypothetical protein